MKNKTRYLVIIWVITIPVMILGSIYHLTNWGDRAGGRSNSNEQQFNDPLDAFERISLDIDLAEIKIQAGSDYHISCKSTKRAIPEYEMKDGVLTVVQESKNPHFPRRNGSDNCTIIITVPSDATISDITGECRLGDFRMDGITVDNASVTCNLGEAILGWVIAKNVTVECNLGNCEMKDCDIDNLTVSNDMGNVEVETAVPLSDYTMELSVSMGGIEIDDEEYGSHYKHKGDKDKTMTITCNMGAIEIVQCEMQE